jgi:hypothetical protein
MIASQQANNLCTVIFLLMIVACSVANWNVSSIYSSYVLMLGLCGRK